MITPNFTAKLLGRLKTSEFTYTVVVTTENKDQADYVMMSRINYDDDYGFDYQVEIEDDSSL